MRTMHLHIHSCYSADFHAIEEDARKQCGIVVGRVKPRKKRRLSASSQT